MKHYILSIFATCLFLLLLSNGDRVSCTEYYWKSPHVKGKWSDLNNWVLDSPDSTEKPKKLPETGDTIYIVQAGNYEVLYDLTPQQASVYESITIGRDPKNLYSPFTIHPFSQVPIQQLIIKSPLTVNSNIHIRNNGVLRMESEQTSISGGAKIECDTGGLVEQYEGSVRTIGDISVNGLYEMHGGEIAGSTHHSLIIAKDGQFKMKGQSAKSAIHRNVKVNGLYDHDTASYSVFSKEFVIDKEGQMVVNALGDIEAEKMIIHGELLVHTQIRINGYIELNDDGKMTLEKPLIVQHALVTKEGSHVEIRHSVLNCLHECTFEGGTIEGFSQTQDNKITIARDGVLTVYDPAELKGNLNVHVSKGATLINWSTKNDFRGDICVDGAIKFVSGAVKLAGRLVVQKGGHLYTVPPPRSSQDAHRDVTKQLKFDGEVLIYGQFTHAHTSDVVFNSALVVQPGAVMEWFAAGVLCGEGTLQNKGTINIGSSSRLAIHEVFNEGKVHVHSSKFTLSAQHFTQKVKEALITLNGARLVIDAHMQLHAGQLRVSGEEQSYLVISSDGHMDQHVPLSGALSVGIHGEYRVHSNLNVERNIDVFPDAHFEMHSGDIVGEGQLIIHREGEMKVTEAADTKLQKVILVAGRLQIAGKAQVNRDITVLEGTGEVQITNSASLSGKGHLSNHGELQIHTDSEGKVGLSINNAGKTTMLGETYITKPFQQIDTHSVTILDHAQLHAEQDFSLADGKFYGVGEIKTPTFNCAGNYGAFVEKKVGTLRIRGDFMSPGTAVAHFRVRSSSDHSVLEVDGELHVDGSTLKIELLDGYNPESTRVELVRAGKLKGTFSGIEMVGGKHTSEVEYKHEEGKVLVNLRREKSSGSSVICGGISQWLLMMGLCMFGLLVM